MAVTITTNSNPLRVNVGKKEYDATIIDSGLTAGTVYYYEIRRLDQQGSVIALDSSQDVTKMANVIGFDTLGAGSASRLKIILEFRTKYQVRVKKDAGAWSAWGGAGADSWFKTRNKKYSTPDEINQLEDTNQVTNATAHTNITQSITNTAKTIESPSGTFTNSQKANMGDVTAYTETDQGATITTGNPSTL